MILYFPDKEAPSCCGECCCSGTDVCRQWMTVKRADLGKKRAEACPIVSEEDDLVSIRAVYWALGSYFIPRMNINHVVSQDISIALSGVNVVIPARKKDDAE